VPPTFAPLSRRTALGAAGVAATVGLSGCTVDLDAIRPPTRRAPEPPANADQSLVDEVVAELRHASQGTAPPFRRLHRSHLGALGATPGRSTARPSQAVVRRREGALAGTLAQAAARAESAELVRLLASMAAGQRQLLALHPEMGA